MSTVQLDVEARDIVGKKVAALRREGLVPANIVSNGKESVAIQVEYNTLLKVLRDVGYTQPVSLKIGSDSHTVLVTEVKQFPARNTIEHVTFQEVKKGEKIQANVPIELVGDAPAARKGLLILQVMDTLEVEADALSIPEHVDVDISTLEEDGDTVPVSSIALPAGVQLLEEPEAAVVKAEAPRVVEEPTESEDTEAESEAGSADSDTSSSEDAPENE